MYHWADKNCATQIRDILDAATGGALFTAFDKPHPLSRRGEALRHFSGDLPLWFGWSFAAGAYADKPLTIWEALFMPDAFRLAVNDLLVPWPNGDSENLVGNTCYWPERHTFVDKLPPKYDLIVVGLGLLWAALILFVPSRAAFTVLIATHGAVLGLMGSFLGFLWWASVLEGFAGNENLMVASPLAVLLVPLCWLVSGGALNPIVKWLLLVLVTITVVGMLVSVFPFTQQDNLAVSAMFGFGTCALVWRSLKGRPFS